MPNLIDFLNAVSLAAGTPAGMFGLVISALAVAAIFAIRLSNAATERAQSKEDAKERQLNSLREQTREAERLAAATQRTDLLERVRKLESDRESDRVQCEKDKKEQRLFSAQHHAALARQIGALRQMLMDLGRMPPPSLGPGAIEGFYSRDREAEKKR